MNFLIDIDLFKYLEYVLKNKLYINIVFFVIDVRKFKICYGILYESVYDKYFDYLLLCCILI